MKRKFSLFLNVAMLCLCVCAIAFGVYSAKQASLNVTGTIGFTAHNCELQVSGTKKGYALDESGTTYKETPEPLIKDGSGNATTANVSTSGTAGSISTLPIGDLKFTDLATDEIPPIVITLTFTNLSAYQVSATVLVDDIANVRYTRQYVMGDGSSLTGLTAHSEAVVLNASTAADGKTATFVITLNVADASKDVANLSSLNITANFAKYDAGSFTSKTVTENNITYTLNGNKTAYSVTGNRLSSPTDVTIPALLNNLPVTSIGDSAFESSSLTSVTIPNSVTSIGYSAFIRCSSLTSITIPSSVGVIGDSAFQNCSSLTSITIPEGVTIIDGYTFFYCTSLGSITIPSSVGVIGQSAFGNCSSLTSITFGANSQLTSIDYGAFQLSALTNITIPEGVTSIVEQTFYGCSSLTSITFGANSQLTSIEDSAFASCTSLTSITIPSSVTGIGGLAFKGCSSLTSVTFADTSKTWNAGGAELTVTDPAQNATNLKTDYDNCTWTKNS